MKAAVALLVVLFLLIGLSSAQDAPAKPPVKNLFFVFLWRPAKAPQYPEAKLNELQAGHMANMKRLYAEQKLQMAGPFLDDTKLRGIFVFTAQSADEVKGWLATDPAIKAGRLEGEVHPWKPAKGEIARPATENGMEKYELLVFRYAENAKQMDDAKLNEAFQRHMKFQLAAFERGDTVIGGPFTDEGDFVGVVIARKDGAKLASEDPLVSAGVAKIEVHPWMTAKGVLGETTK